MTPLEALLELLDRMGASRDAAALVSEEELRQWPIEAVRALKSHKLLVKASPATTVVCPGCEQECTMPVDTVSAGTGKAATSFVVCDKRDDINRVAVSAERLRQWRASAAPIADLITGLLGLRSPDAGAISSGRWEIGMLKGRKYSSHIVLIADGQLTLCVAGHTVALADVLTLGGGSFKLDKQTLIRFVDKPVAGAGDQESAAQRRDRLKKRVQSEKAKGNKAFLKKVSEEESISVSRLKQLLAKPSETKATHRRPTY
jgi:hypothetical protein